MYKNIPITNCINCIHYSNVSRNMIGMRWISCKKEVPYRKMNPSCGFFEPTLYASNSYYLKELYDNFIDYNNIEFDKPHSHYWRLVDDGNPKNYKRISGRTDMYLRFNMESELDEFYSKHKEIINNADLQLNNR